MINIDDDDNINGLLKKSRTESNGMLVFVTRRIGEKDGIQNLCQDRLVVVVYKNIF